MKCWTLLLACVPLLATAQIKTKLKPEEAIKLREGELVRYFKTRPTQMENGLPYQVLIVVTEETFTVKTNAWQHTEARNLKQRASLQESLEFVTYERLNMFPHEKGTREDEHDRLFFYLSARKGKEIITWNSKKHDLRGQLGLVEILEVYHYFAKEAKEKGGLSGP